MKGNMLLKHHLQEMNCISQGKSSHANHSNAQDLIMGRLNCFVMA